jgi:hypothetical protein
MIKFLKLGIFVIFVASKYFPKFSLKNSKAARFPVFFHKTMNFFDIFMDF